MSWSARARGTRLQRAASAAAADRRPHARQDNCSFHRYETGALAEYLLSCYNVRIVYLPPYSPEKNPIESAFNVFKFHLRRSNCKSVIDACREAWSHVNLRLAHSFYKGCGYIS